MSALVRVSHGVWREESAVADLAGRVSALLTATSDTTVVSGVTAARLHGLWLPAGPGTRIETIVHPEVPTPRTRSGSRRAELRARRQHLRTDEVVETGYGFLMTTEARTWVDLADRLSLFDLVAAGDSALRGAATEHELHEQVRRAVHRRGVVRAREALGLLDARSRSRPESHLRCIVVTAGLPRPEVNVAIRDCHGGWVAEPDLVYEDTRLAIEYNGADHARAGRMRNDITRSLDVEGRGGWRSVTFGAREVFDRPDEVVSHVRRLRREQALLLALRPEPWG